MAQHDYTIANQGFPATRSDINNVLSAISTNNSGTSAPSTQYAGQFWIDTTSSTWTMYIHDGADDIQFATIDTSANTVNFTDSALDVVTDTTPQLGGDLDLNSNDITGTGDINITGDITASGNLLVDTIEPQSGTTLTLGASGDTINLASGATAGFGKVLQVVTAFNAASVSTTSTSFVDITSVSASITPNSTSNKILVIYSSDANYTLVSGANVSYFHIVLRNTTQISQRLIAADSVSGGLQARGSMCITTLDSPNTTSSVTYKAQHKLTNGSSTGTTNDTSITLMEIAG